MPPDLTRNRKSISLYSRSAPANCLRMLLQRQYILLILFRTLKVGEGRVEPAAS